MDKSRVELVFLSVARTIDALCDASGTSPAGIDSRKVDRLFWDAMAERFGGDTIIADVLGEMPARALLYAPSRRTAAALARRD